MPSKRRHLKYLVLFVLALFVGGVVYVAGKTPQIIDATIARLSADLQKKQGIRLQLGQISVEGFLTVRVDGFVLEKKDMGLYVQAKSIKARLSPIGYWLDGNPVSRLEVDTPEVMAKIDLNLKTSKKESFKPNFTLNEFIIRQGRADITLNDKVVQIINLRANSKITPRLIDIRSLLVQTPEVSFQAHGKMLLNDPNHLGLGSDLSLKLSGQLSKIPEIRHLKIPVEADVNVEGKLTYPSKERGFEFEGQAQASRIRIDTVQIASVSAPVFLNQNGLELRKAKVGFAGTTVNLTAQLKFDKQFQFSGEVDAAGVSLYELLSDLDVKGSWVDLKLETKGSLTGQIKPEFSLNGHAKGEAVGLVVKDKQSLILQTAYPIPFDMDIAVNKHAFQFKNARFHDAKSRLVADCNLYLDRPGMWLDGRFENLDFASVKNRIADGTYSGSGEALVLIQGLYEHLRIQAPSQIMDFKFEGIPFGNVNGLFLFEDNQIWIKDIKAKQKSLEYTGNLSVLMEKPLQVTLDANLNKGLAQDLTGGMVSGPVEGHMVLNGPLEKGHRSQLSGNLNLTVLNNTKPTTAILDLRQGVGSLKIANSLAGDAEFGLQILNDKLSADGLFKDSQANAQINIELDEQLPFSANLFMPYGPIKNLEDWNAQAGVYLKAHGRLADIENAEADLDLSPAVFYLGTLKFLATNRVSARYQDKKLSIEPAVFKSVHGDQIKLQGNLNRQGIDLDVTTQGDLWFLTHLDERIEGAYGDFNAHLQVKGPWEKLEYFGKGQIASGSYLSLRDYPPGLTGLSGQINFQGQRAALKLSGQSDRGHFDLDGQLNLADGSFEHLQVNLNQMPVYYSSFLTGIADGFLQLEGSFREPTLSGDVKFSQMLITKELDPTELKAPRSRAKKQSVKLNVSLSAQDNVRVESKSFNAELKGNLKLVGNTNSPGLMGEITVLSGEVYFRNHYYHIVKARANFDNPFRIVPYIDVEANSQIMDYDVTVHAQGELSKPKLLFSSKPSLPQTDLLSLITFGFTNRDNRDNLGVARTAGLEALSLYSGVGDRVLKLLPENSIDELRFGTLYNQNGGVTSSVVLGMQVFKTMRLRFQSAMIQNTAGNREKRLELEKYINKRWRWRLIWNSEGVTNYGDAGADLWIRWDY